mgnify:CR=1 FL=1
MSTATTNRIEEFNGETNEVATKKATGSKKAEKKTEGGVVIERIQPSVIELEVIGTTQLLVCAWSFKAKKQMLDKQMKKATRGKEAKNPEEDYKNSRYQAVDPNGEYLWDGIPAGGVKGCLVNACRAVDGLPMTLAKRMVFVRSQGFTKDGQGLVRVYGEHKMHEGMVRIDNGGTADIRFRAVYPQWSLKLQIEFLSSVISAEQVCNLVELAGFIEGLCEHRPGAPKSNTGDNGRFMIKERLV